MKVYVILVDYRNDRTKVYGVYKQYRHAYQEEQRLLNIVDILSGDRIKVRIVEQEVTE